jgi:hypothetical protein
MIHRLDPGLGDSTFPILDVVPADDFLHAGHLFSFTAASWSMFPTIRKGDVLTIEATDRIRVGDVVVFPFMGALVCHRVKNIGADGKIHTQGDAANRLDAPIQRQNILGKVTEIIRGHDRLVPAPVPRPSPAGLVRMKIDFFQMRLRERLLEWGSKSLAFLKRRAPLKIMAALALKRYARFYLGVRAPLQSMQAYRFLPLPRTDHDGRLDGPLPPEFDGASDVLIQARLGRHRLGTWHPASGTMRIRQAAAGLGLEDSLRAALPAP